MDPKVLEAFRDNTIVALLVYRDMTSVIESGAGRSGFCQTDGGSQTDNA